MYRRSRTLEEIAAKTENLRLRDSGYLADILIGVGPQYGQLGKHVTWSAPGESWHQYGRAFDAVPMRDGKCLWDEGYAEWDIYGDIVKTVGLYWSGTWTKFHELPHALDNEIPNPLTVLSRNSARESIIRS